MSSHLIQPVATEVGPGLLSSTTTSIPLSHLYSLSTALLLMIPRTTHQQMLETDLFESMHENCSGNIKLAATKIPLLLHEKWIKWIVGNHNLISANGIKDMSMKATKPRTKMSEDIMPQHGIEVGPTTTTIQSGKIIWSSLLPCYSLFLMVIHHKKHALHCLLLLFLSFLL